MSRGVKAITGALELELVLTIVLGAENVTTPDNAVLWGMHPSVRVDVDDDDDPPTISKVLVKMH